MSDRHEEFMHRAIALASASMLEGNGGPFAAVIVQGEEVIGEGANHVLKNHDPTAHGEIMAIRAACARLQTFSLEDATIYTTGQPCPMCLGAIHWARISRIYYGFSITDAAAIGFDDTFIFEQFALPAKQRKISATELCRDEALQLARDYASLPNRITY